MIHLCINSCLLPYPGKAEELSRFRDSLFFGMGSFTARTNISSSPFPKNYHSAFLLMLTIFNLMASWYHVPDRARIRTLYVPFVEPGANSEYPIACLFADHCNESPTWWLLFQHRSPLRPRLYKCSADYIDLGAVREDVGEMTPKLGVVNYIFGYR